MFRNNQITFLLLGAGIIGVSIARELKRRYPNINITIIEKEARAGEHASGRNSGVLHAGFYYTKDSLKAKFTKLGNAALTQYCLDKNIPINRCGKLVVARHEKELEGLQELFRRGKQNDIDVQIVSEKEAHEIEPRAKTFHQALFSPTTSSVDPRIVMQHMVDDAIQEGIQIHYNTRYLRHHDNTVITNQGNYTYQYLINAAGLYADKIAKEFGFSKDFEILPFKGLYLYGAATEQLKTHIYPVPVLENPFLGVHFTLTVDGIVKVGPTAIPAFWREQYHKMSKFNVKEMIEIMTREVSLFFNAGFNFKRLAWNEIKKYHRSTLLKHAEELVSGIDKNNFKHWGKPGIRAQLLNTRTKTLEMDFMLEGDDQSFHVLNAVSPAFTCAIPFSQYAVDHIQQLATI